MLTQAAEPIVRLILDGTVVRVRLDRKAISISLLVVLGVRADGQKVLLAIKSMGGESYPWPRFPPAPRRSPRSAQRMSCALTSATV